MREDVETSRFKQQSRLHQALWREKRGYPIGSQPMCPEPGDPSRPLGSRMDLKFSYDTEANFLNEDIRRVVRNRLANPQPHQTLAEDRLYCDLLSSMPMCFNLFGGLQSDLEMADRALHAWWPDVPGRVCAVHFEWSPGRRLKGEYLENRSAFDVAFELVLPDGGRGVFGVETKYHENCKKEDTPSDDPRRRYTEIALASGLFTESAVKQIMGTDL